MRLYREVGVVCAVRRGAADSPKAKGKSFATASAAAQKQDTNAVQRLFGAGAAWWLAAGFLLFAATQPSGPRCAVINPSLIRSSRREANAREIVPSGQRTRITIVTSPEPGTGKIISSPRGLASTSHPLTSRGRKGHCR
jgi:hypothetical protein